MGVVNVTPDSFSDGGRFFDPAAAVEHARKLSEEGADLVDVGGESTRPGAAPVSEEEELRRLLPVLEKISDLCVSVDTRRPRVMREVLKAGASMINDVDALSAPGAREAVAAGADYVKTSTGFSSAGATVADVALLRRVVGPEIGVKAAGGIRDTATALAMIAAGATRIGASRTGDILAGLAEPGSASD